MSLSIVIIDDEKPARLLLGSYIEKTPELELAGVFSNALEAKAFLEQNQVDIMLLDIRMDDLSGLDLLRLLRERPVCILTTAYSEHAIEAFELDVIDYLLKPIAFNRFLQAIEKASGIVSKRKNAAGPTGEISEKQVPAATPDYFFVKTNRKILRLEYDDLVFVESYGEYVKIHTQDKVHMVLQRMSVIEAQLPKDRFFRIHRSYLINMGKISEIEGNSVLIRDHHLSISKRSKEAFMQAIRDKGLLG